MSRVAVDIDDVLFPWYEKAHSASTLAGITNGHEATTWEPFANYGCTLQEWLDVLESVTLDGTLYSGEPYEGVVDALQRLHDHGHTIHLVTARGFLAHGWLIRKQTVEWLDEHKIPHDSLTFTKDKTFIDAEFFIDDSVANVRALHAAKRNVWLMRQPHNEELWDAWWPRAVDSFPEFVEKSGVLNEW